MAKAPATKTHTFTERFQMNREGLVVDVEKGTISGVRLCGEHSANGRRYPKSAFTDAVEKYEGKKSYYGHGNGGERELNSLAAKIVNVTIDSDGLPRGTLQVFKAHKDAALLFEVANTAPEAIGMSHVADCKSRYQGGIEIIESIVSVKSVDIVMDPATNPKGFAESKGKTMPKITVKALIESLIPKLSTSAKMVAARRLAEMDSVPDDLETDTPADDASPDQSLESALEQLCAAVARDGIAGTITSDEAAAKIKAYIDTHLGKAPADDSGEDEGDAEESKKKKAGTPDPIREALAVAKKIGFRADEDELETIAATPAEKREAVAKKLKLTAEGATGTPRSGTRDSLTTPKPKTNSESAPTDLSTVKWD